MSGTFIKVIALIAMVLDHIGSYIPNTPEELRWIGRIAAPIFLFFIVEGFEKTRNQKKYIFRLYIAGIFMAVLTLIINSLLGYSGQDEQGITANFFATLFAVAWILFLIQKKKMKYWIYFALWQLLSSFLCVALSEIVIIHNSALYYFYAALFGNIFFVEGSIFMVLLGVLFFITKTNRQLIFNYITFVLLLYIVVLNFGLNPSPFSYYFLPFAEYQWLMIAALPFFLLYNGKRGIGMKYFFYVFYPLHIILLFFIGRNFL